LSLLLERDNQHEAALDALNRLSDILEQEYEESEDEDTLSKFCTVKSDLGRNYLALENYEAAVENCSTALDLSHELEDLEKMRLSAQLTLGMSYYFLGQTQDAIDVFQTVLAESNEDIDVMLLVAQALWAAGGQQEREIAVQQIHDWYLFCMRR
jgi:superkiller protein 3